MTAIILAGGKATRMGCADKAFLRLGREMLIKRQLRLIRKLFKKIIIVTNSPQRYRNLNGVRIVTDLIPNRGPLGGIYSGLQASEDDYNFVLACDMPFINLDLISYMLKKIKGFDIVIPRYNRKFEPLYAVYSRNCIKPIENGLSRKNLKITRFLQYVKVRIISKKEITQFDLNGISFVNINTPNDYRRLK